jgi:hypothetical protein
MWQHLRGVSAQRAVMDVAKKVDHISKERYRWLLRMAGEVSDDPEEIIRQAIAAGHLVLTDAPEHPRAAYWNGDLIKIDWLKFDKLWLYLWNLARGAKAGISIDRFAFGGELDCEYLTKQKSRLTNLESFPVDLGDKIVSAGRGTQTLDLDRESIRIIERQTIEISREYVG